MTTHHQKDPASRWMDTAEQKQKYAELAGPKQEKSLIDELIAGELTTEQVAKRIFDEAYGSMKHFYEIPTHYRRCRLGIVRMAVEQMSADQLDALVLNPPAEIVDPSPAQLRAVLLFKMLLAGDPLICVDKDPFKAKIGANFFGAPGTGKTHIMASFGNLAAIALEQRLQQYRSKIAEFVKREYALLTKRVQKLRDPNASESRFVINDDPNGEIKEEAAPAVVFREHLAQLQTSLAKLEHQPTDLMYIGFDVLCELARKEEQRDALFVCLNRAKLVFIDDVHPKEDPERGMIVQQIIERRYEEGRRGTFLTTNLEPGKIGGGDENISSRLLSRCGEMMLTIDFKNSRDWRAKVNSRRVALVDEELTRRIAALDTAPA